MAHALTHLHGEKQRKDIALKVEPST